MTNSETLLRMILGPARPDLRPLALAVDITDDLLFSQHISMDDILVTKYVYPDVAKQMGKNPASVSKRIERLAHRCWDSLKEQNLDVLFLGRSIKQPPSPHELLVYLAVYNHFKLPFFAVIEQYPSFLFQTPADFPEGGPLQAPPLADALRRTIPVPVSQAMAFQTHFGTTTYPVCPACLITMEHEYQNFCDRCGQALNWADYHSAQVIFPNHDHTIT